MAKYAWPAGSTSKTVLLFIQDSASTTGAGRASVSAGNINAQEIRVQTNNTVTRVTVSVTNLVALTDAYLAGGIFPVDPVNTPGWYRFDIPNTALSSGAVTAAISIIGSLSASNIAQLALEIQLQNSPVDVITWNGVSVSASYLMPSVVRQWDQTSVSSSNLAVQDFSTRLNANVQQWAGTSVSSNNIVLRSEISLSTVNVTAWAGVSVSTANVALWQTISSANVTQWSGASTSSNDVALYDNSQIFNTLVGLAVNVTRWNNTSVSSSNIAIKNTLAKTTHITGFNDLSQATLSSVVFGSAMTEDYAIDGAAFTLPQALYQMWSRLSEFSISDKTITAFKLDGTTQAMTFSLDSATAPTKVERVT